MYSCCSAGIFFFYLIHSYSLEWLKYAQVSPHVWVRSFLVVYIMHTGVCLRVLYMFPWWTWCEQVLHGYCKYSSMHAQSPNMHAKLSPMPTHSCVFPVHSFMFVYVCVHTCLCVDVYAYMHTCIHAYMHTSRNKYMHRQAWSLHIQRLQSSGRDPQHSLHAHMHAHIHTYFYTPQSCDIFVLWHFFICAHIYIRICIHIYIHTHKSMIRMVPGTTKMHTGMHTYIRIHIHTHTFCNMGSSWYSLHTYTHTCIHTYIHACMHTCAQILRCGGFMTLFPYTHAYLHIHI